MKKILIGLLAVFVLSTSYATFDTGKLTTKENKTNDTAAAVLSFASIEPTTTSKNFANEKYKQIDFSKANSLSYNVFEIALQGFEKLKKEGEISPETRLLSIVDFSLSSNQPRLWVIDVENGELLFNTLVAHGKNTGEEFATSFSNVESSYQSSMGFYKTDFTYMGDNGYSLKLLGLDEGYNDQALTRAIVMHGAKYVSEEFGKLHKRIGRSWGCPAVPSALARPIIDSIKEGSVLFHYYPDENYLASSKWLK